MKKHFLFFTVTVLFSIRAIAQLYNTTSGKIDFYSSTPVENIEAYSNNCAVILDTKTNNIAFQVSNTSFQFPNKLMQEHFNEKYMESGQFPRSTFIGKINEPIDYTHEGEYEVTATGKLTIHGVPQHRTIKGKLVVKQNTIYLTSDFTVKVADHKITVPTIIVMKVSEEITVHVDAALNEKK